MWDEWIGFEHVPPSFTTERQASGLLSHDDMKELGLSFFYVLIFNFTASYIWKELKLPTIIDINWYSYYE